MADIKLVLILPAILSIFFIATGAIQAQADPDRKEKQWNSEDGGAFVASCDKDENPECIKKLNVNKEARELCQERSETKCKNVQGLRNRND